MKIAITGETGFLGYYLTQYLKYYKHHEIIELGKNYQHSIDLLKNCDWLIHCAGTSRGVDVKSTNTQLANELTELLILNNIKINIFFMSSIQEDTDNEYGNSKKLCKSILSEYTKNVNTKLISYKLPNLFGPFSKPNYNSVVATFCYNINNNLPCTINDSVVSLSFVGDIAESISSFNECDTFKTHDISIKDLHDTITHFHNEYSLGIIPTLDSSFKIQLFNTYRSYSKCLHKFIRSSDERGHLLELVKSNTTQSQVFFSTTYPGITRGNHFHFNKIERFCVLKGKANIEMRKIGSKEKISYIINDLDDTVVDMPILYTHNITNVGDSELVCVFWVNEIFDNFNPDTFYIAV